MSARNEVYSIFRFAFVLCIVGYHFAPAAQREGWWFFSGGQVLVTFFFVLSGFLARLSSRRAKQTAAEFWRRKFGSLIPLYYAALLLAVLIESAAGGFRPAVIAADILLMQAWIPDLQLALNAPAWFMSALVACFLIWPAMWKMRPARLLPVAGLVWVAVQLTSVWLYAEGQLGEFSYWLYFPPFHFASFLVGAVAADGCRAAPTNGLSALWFSAALLLLALYLAVLPAGPDVFRMCSEISLAAPLFGFLIWAVAVLPEKIAQRFDRRWIATLGLLAYPIYLLQLPIYKMFHQLVLKPDSAEMNWMLFGAYLLVLCAAGMAWLWVLSRRGRSASR